MLLLPALALGGCQLMEPPGEDPVLVKLEELERTLKASLADLLIVNHELSAGQQRNLETDLGCRVITRST